MLLRPRSRIALRSGSLGHFWPQSASRLAGLGCLTSSSVAALGSPFGLEIWWTSGFTGRQLRGVGGPPSPLPDRSRVALRPGNQLHFSSAVPASVLATARRSGQSLCPGLGCRDAPHRSSCSAFPSRDARSPGSGRCSCWSVAGHESPLPPGHETFLALNHPCTSGIGGRRFPSRLGILHPCPVGHAASPFGSRLVTGRPGTPSTDLHDRRSGDAHPRSHAALPAAPSPSAVVVFLPPWASVAG